MDSPSWKRIRALISLIASAVLAPVAATGAEKIEEVATEETSWKESGKARANYLQQHFGDLPPGNRMRLINLMSVARDSSLYTIEAKKLGKDVWAYSTFGLSNPDMPTRIAAVDPQDITDDFGRLAGLSATMETRSREPATAPAGAAGYGYELMVLAGERAFWPLHILQWAASAEIFTDVGLLDRVDREGGLTVRDVALGSEQMGKVNLLFAKPLPPLPTGTQLPNGSMRILLATVITADELAWSRINGVEALLARLARSGVGQFSFRDRKSVLI